MIPGAVLCLMATLLAMLFSKKDRDGCLGCLGVLAVVVVIGFLYLITGPH